MKFLRARDKNEAEIVRALRAAGASVTTLTPSGKKEDRGVPDLLVGFMRATLLLEVKPELAAIGGKGRGSRGGKGHVGGKSNKGMGGDGVLTEGQIEWWGAWRGMAPTIVRNVEEALGCLRVIRDAIAAGAHVTVPPFTPPGIPSPSEPGAST